MANTTPKMDVVSNASELPGGVIPENGVTHTEAAEGLFELLGSENEEFFEEPVGEDDSANLEDENGEESEADFEEAIDEDDEDDEDFDVEELDELEESEDGENSKEPEEDLFVVTLPGGEKAQVTLDELTAGYSRTEDYTRKRQRDAAEHAEMLAETRDKRETYVNGLEKLTETLRALGPQKPESDLRQANPGEYAAQLADWQAYEDSIFNVESAKDQVQNEISQENLQTAHAYIQQEWTKVVSRVPEWANEAQARTDLSQLREHGINDLGFTEIELDSLNDARLLLMLKENYDLKQAQKNGKKGVEKKKKSSKRLAAGKAKSPGSRKSTQRKRQRGADVLAATTGSVSNAARAIELALIAEEG